MAPPLHVSVRPAHRSRRILRLAGGCAGLALLTACAAGGSHGAGGGAVAQGPTTQYYVNHAAHDYRPPGPPGDPWGPYIDEASARFDVPTPWIRSVMHQESGGHEYIDGQLTVSYAGAMGLMQLEPGTYQEMASRYGLGGDPFNPYDNIMAGTAYIHEMYEVYGAPGFLAAYNAGPGRLDQFINYNETLPDQTTQYVAIIAPEIQGYYPRNRSEADQLALNTEPTGTSTGILPVGYSPDAPRLPDPDSGSHDMMLAMNTREQPVEAVSSAPSALSTGDADDSADAENAVAAQQVAARAATLPKPAAAPVPAPAPVEVASIAPVQAAPLQPAPAPVAQPAPQPAPVQMAMADTGTNAGSALGAASPVPAVAAAAPASVAPASVAPASVAPASAAPASVAPIQMASLGGSSYAPPVLQQATYSPAASQAAPHYLPGAPHAYPNFAAGGGHHFSLIPAAMADTPSPAANGAEGGWAVQVGAFNTQAKAHEAIGMAESGAMRALMGGQPMVVTAHLAGGTKYRARITNLAHGDAVDACSRLSGGPTGCVVLSPEAQS